LRVIIITAPKAHNALQLQAVTAFREDKIGFELTAKR